MTNEEALKFLDEHCTASVIPFEVKILCSKALEKQLHRCSNCKYNDTCKGVAVEEGNTIKFHSEEGYCCMWEASND